MIMTTITTTTTTTSQQSDSAREREEEDGGGNVCRMTTETTRMRGNNYVVDVHVLEELGGQQSHTQALCFVKCS
jgi:hypothetical protein